MSTRGVATPSASPSGATYGRIVKVLASDRGRAFYKYDDPFGACYGVGEIDALRHVVLGSEICPDGGFPSTRRPVLISMGVESTKTEAGITIRKLGGFAADGVSEIVLVSRGGATLGSARVHRNTFVVPVAGRRLQPSALIAKDTEGKEVYRQTF